MINKNGTKINIMQKRYLMLLTVLAVVPLIMLLDQNMSEAQANEVRTYSSIIERDNLIKTFESSGYTLLHDDYTKSDGTQGTLTFFIDNRIPTTSTSLSDEITNIKTRVTQLESDVAAMKP